MNCASQKTSDIKEIIYNAITRGRSENITLKGSALQYKTTQKSIFINLTKKQLAKVNTEVSKINLNEINTLKAPTDKRFYDGAMHTSILIKSNSMEYTSATFDDTNPPAELKALCQLLLNLAKNN
tara:strand:- start:135 stop:509 length:375 start_codon:yes stop_codon:yes gene_type:complete